MSEVTASKAASRVRSFRERFEEALREVEAEMASGTYRPEKPTTRPVNAVDTSAWTECISVAEVRDRLLAAGAAASVRAVAREVDSSASRVGDLLKIRDAFPQPAVDWIGLTLDFAADDPFKFSQRGAQRLSLLSFRSLRSLSRLPYRERVRKARELAKEAGSKCRTTVTTVGQRFQQPPPNPTESRSADKPYTCLTG